MPGFQTNGFDQLEAARRKSIKLGDVPLGGSTILQLFVPASPLRATLPPALPFTLQQRDRVLSLTPRADAQWGAAIGIAVTKIASLAWEARSSVGIRSRKAQELLLNADSALGQGGWVHYLAKQVRDYLCTNNGCVTEIVRETLAYGSRIVGINHLPSIRCRRTGLPEKPVIYIDKMGREHLLNWWQVMYFSDLPDPDEVLYGGGLCAAERAYPQIIKMAAIELFIYEKVSGSRPLAVHIISGLKTDQIEDAIKSAEDQMAREGLTAYMGAVIMATINPTTPPSIVTIPLAELPPGFDAKMERDRADLIYSNAIGLDPQDLSPLATSNLGTATQSLVLHDKAKGRGLLMFRQAFVHAINQLVMDSKTKFIFTERDLDDQLKSAQVSKARVDVASARVESQITTAEQEKQILVDLDELPRSFIEADTIPGESLSDTDKEEVDETGEGLGDATEEVGPLAEQNLDVGNGSSTPSSNQPYLLTAGKSKRTEQLFSNDPIGRSKKYSTIKLEEDPDLLELVNEAMSSISKKSDFSWRDTTSRGGRDVGSVGILLRCPNCFSRILSRKSCLSCGSPIERVYKQCPNCSSRVISKKECHTCGLNFHKGGGGGGSSSTGSGKKMTPKLAKSILADPNASAKDKLAASHHLYDKGYIGKNQHKAHVDEFSASLGSAPKPSGGGTSWKDTVPYETIISPHLSTTPSAQSHAAQVLLNSQTSSTVQKQAAADHLYDQGFLTGAQYNNLKGQIQAGGPLNVQVHHDGKFVSVSTPTTKVPSFKDDGHAYNSMLATSTSPAYKKASAEHLLNSSSSTASQKDLAADYLYAKGHMTKEKYDELKGSSGSISSTVGGSKLPSSLQKTHSVMNDPSAGPHQKSAAAHSLLTNPAAPHELKVEAASHILGSSVAGPSEKQDAKVYLAKTGETKTPGGAPLGPIQNATHAGQVLKDDTAPKNQKVLAANHLFNKGYITKDEYDAEMGKISGPSKAATQTHTFGSMGEANLALMNPKSTPQEKVAAASHLYKKGMFTKEEYEAKLDQISGASAASKPVPTPSGIVPSVTVSKPSHAKSILADQNAPADQKLAAAKLLYDKGYSSKKTYDLQLQQIQGGGAVTPKHTQQSALNAAQAKVHAHQNPSTTAAQQATTAQQTAQNSLGGAIVHQRVPGNARQFVGADGTTSQAAASKWGKETYKSWEKSLTAEEKEAVTTYTGSWATDVNAKLRTSGDVSSWDKSSVANLDKALAKGSLPEDLIVHRGMSYSKLTDAMESGALTPGSILHDKGYGSSSVHSDRAFTGNVRLRVRVPAGSPGAYVENLSSHKSELEFLLPRNSSYVIKGYQKVKTKSGGTFWLVDAEYAGSGEVII